MRGMASVVVSAAGAVLVLAGIAMPITSDAELWWAPVVVGASISLLGLVLIAAGRSPRRSAD
jgi:hypothetical protein